MSIYQTGKPLTFTNSNGGTDSFTIGNASQGTGGIAANLKILAFGFAANNVIVDNFGGANRTATLAAGAPGEYVLGGFAGGGNIAYNRQAFNSGESFTPLRSEVASATRVWSSPTSMTPAPIPSTSTASSPAAR